ncbi:MAG: hypothetical protein AAGK05_05200 [Pseudomonadota bacterium]
MSIEFYARPTFMSGGNYRVYAGGPFQRGGGILSSIRSYLAPMGSKALQGIKTIARNKTVQNIARKAAEKGAEVLTSVAVDALQGHDVGNSFKERSRQMALNTLTGNSSNASYQPTRRKKLKQKRGKKRLPSTKRIASEPLAKKNRVRPLSRAKLNRSQLF